MIIHEFQGRSGNVLLQNISTSIISKKFNLKVFQYAQINNIETLGLSLHDGDITYTEFKKYDDTRLIELLNQHEINYGIHYNGTCQIKEFVLNYKNEILNHFKLKYTEVNKDDVFVHVRLDDAAHVNSGVEYYDKCLSSTKYRNGYISTDSPNNVMIKFLIKKHNLILYLNDPINTINFAKNFNNIILSKGTFSWWIGFLSKADNIYYPIGDPMWYGNIFVYDSWKSIPI